MAKKKKRPQPTTTAKKPKEGSVRFKEQLPLCIVMILLYAAGLTGSAVVFLRCDKLPLPDLYIVLLCLAPAALLSSFLKAKKEKQHGLLTGFLWTLPVHLILFGASLLFGGGRIDWTMPLSFVILSLLSMLGGVLGVNQRETLRHRPVKHA